MKAFLPSIVTACVCGLAATASENLAPHLETQNGVRQLIVDGQPFLILGGELHNSSSSSREYMKPIWPQLVEQKLNTVLAAVSWELIEPQEGKFNFSTVDDLILDARQNDVKLVFLWFGSWKNGLSSYSPLWVKRDSKRFPLVKNSSGDTEEILSTFSEANCQADAKAFGALMGHIHKLDGQTHTVLMVQVENEVGILGDSRDHCAAANAAFEAPIPKDLMCYLVRHKSTLAPELLAVWAANGNKTSGNWEEVFGPGKRPPVQPYGRELNDRQRNALWRQLSWASDEFFMAWRYSSYIDKVAAAGKAEYNIPTYCNAWLQQPACPRPGEYPSGGPVPQVHDIWRCEAPHIDFLSPDLYISDFDGTCGRFTRNGNPLFIPETNTGADAAQNALSALLKFNAIGFSPFGIDGSGAFGREAEGANSTPSQDSLAQTYAILDYLAPYILGNQGKGSIAFLPSTDKTHEFTQNLKLGDYTLSFSPYKDYLNSRNSDGTLSVKNLSPARFAINTGSGEYVFVDGPADVTFTTAIPGNGKVLLGSFDETILEHGRWVPGRRMNGDETHHNQLWQNMRSFGIYRYAVFKRE